MRGGFKAQAVRDLKNVFHKTCEFADKTTVTYNGQSFLIPVVIDSEEAIERTKPSSDHADGIFIADLTVYIAFADIGIVPRKETRISVDEITYNIKRVGYDAGEITLDLELLDE